MKFERTGGRGECICLIRALLKKCDFDLGTDFVYSARPNET